MNAVISPTLPPTAGDPTARFHSALTGALVGTAVGDSLGLPMEGVSRRRQPKLFPPPLRQRLIGRFGMISDDTEHTLMAAQTLLDHPDDAAAFRRCLAGKLRWWFAALPPGVGFATARSIIRLWLGWPPTRSGVNSAGNGPAMRSAVLGVYFAEDPARRRDFVRASAVITHSDPRAEVAAQAVAETAAWMAGRNDEPEELLTNLESLAQDAEWPILVSQIRMALAENESVRDFAERIGAKRDISGYAYQTAPAAIYTALRHPDDFRAAMTEALACGGDSDTVGAIVGALIGARVGIEGIPCEWREAIVEWPRSIRLAQNIAERLARQQRATEALGGIDYFWPALPIRNLLFLGIVLAHGFRRLFPPY